MAICMSMSADRVVTAAPFRGLAASFANLTMTPVDLGIAISSPIIASTTLMAYVREALIRSQPLILFPLIWIRILLQFIEFLAHLFNLHFACSRLTFELSFQFFD